MEKLKDSKAHLIWQSLIFFLIAWTAIEAPLTYVKYQKDIKSWQLVFDAFMTLVFAMDIYINIQNKAAREEKEFSEHTLPVFHDYDKSWWLPIDIASCIPFDILVWSMGLPVDASLFRMLRLVKVVRVAKIYGFLSSISLLPKSVKISTILISVCIIIHWIACGWIIFGDPVQNTDFLTTYNLALYWTVTTLTTIGYGDITPTSNIGRMFTMSIMLLGVGVYGIVIGTISKILVSASRHKEKMREKMQDLSLLMKHYEVPRKVQTEVFSYYHNIAKSRLTDNDQKIVNELPHNLKTELEVYMVLKLVSGIPLFEGLKLRELKSVAKNLTQEFYSPGDPIIKKGTRGEKMFIISNGSVNVYNQNEEVINALKSGQFFGEIALIMDIERGHNVSARSYCDVYSLHKEDFVTLMNKYETLEKNINKVIVKRKTDNEKKEEEEKLAIEKVSPQKENIIKKTTKKTTSKKAA